MRRTKLHKQLKSRIWKRRQHFFVSCAPGFEKELEAEIGTHIPGCNIREREFGGIGIVGDFDCIYRANLLLRTANRIRMRIARFDARSFRTLEEQAGEIPWPLFLPGDVEIPVKVTAKKSKLHHTGAIAERISMAIATTMASRPHESAKGDLPVPELHVRVIRDRFTLSVDTTGPLLHLRGLKTQGGAAPIRETLAASALMRAGYDGSQPLSDPMCGTGTFSLEASLMAGKIAPGGFRNFAFMNWPSFREERWKAIVEESREAAVSPAAAITAADIDAETVKRFAKRLEGLPFPHKIACQTADFLATPPEGEPGIIVLNPPYGLRLDSPREARDGIQQILGYLKKHYTGWKAVLTLPEVLCCNLPKGALQTPFLHGGIPMQLVIFTCR